MIQRIQTIWLLLAGIAALLTLKFPFYSGVHSPAIPYSELNGVTAGVLSLMLTVAIAVLAFVAIGLFKTRIMQLRLSIVGILLELLLVFVYYQHVRSDFTQGNPALTSILHLLVIVFLVLAARGVNNDEKLIKESDRLR